MPHAAQVSTGSGSDRVQPFKSVDLKGHAVCILMRIDPFAMNDVESLTRSHPPPHAGCPRGDPGPLPVRCRSTSIRPGRAK